MLYIWWPSFERKSSSHHDWKHIYLIFFYFVVSHGSLITCLGKTCPSLFSLASSTSVQSSPGYSESFRRNLVCFYVVCLLVYTVRRVPCRKKLVHFYVFCLMVHSKKGPRESCLFSSSPGSRRKACLSVFMYMPLCIVCPPPPCTLRRVPAQKFGLTLATISHTKSHKSFNKLKR